MKVHTGAGNTFLCLCLTRAADGQPLGPGGRAASVAPLLRCLVGLVRLPQHGEQEPDLGEVVFLRHPDRPLRYPVAEDVPGVGLLHPLHPGLVPILAVAAQPRHVLRQPRGQRLVLAALRQAPGGLGDGGRAEVLDTELAEVAECLGVVSLHSLHHSQKSVY